MPLQLFEGYQRFLSGYFSRHREELFELAKKQSPTIAIISCCDSRVDPSVIFDAALGDIFVIRNIANLVPPFESEGNHHGTSASLEFAVTKLGVKYVVILGHARCGGIKMLLSGNDEGDSDFLDQWMSIARQAIERVQQQKNSIKDEDMAQACEKASAILSMENLMTFPWIRDRVKQGELSLHAWYYDMEGGSLELLSNSELTKNATVHTPPLEKV